MMTGGAREAGWVCGLWFLGLSGCASQPDRLHAPGVGDHRVAPAPRLVSGLEHAGDPLWLASWMVSTGERAYFVGMNARSRCALWMTDGTEEGTRPVWTPEARSCVAIKWVGALPGRALFLTRDDRLMRVDGERVSEVLRLSPPRGERSNPPLPDEPPQLRCDERVCPGRGVVGDRTHLYWFGPRPGGGDALWRSDGTVAGTRPLRLEASRPQRLFQHEGVVWLWRAAGSGVELWRLGADEASMRLVVRDERPGRWLRTTFTSRGRLCMLVRERAHSSSSEAAWCLDGEQLVRAGPELERDYVALVQSYDQAPAPAPPLRQRIKLGEREIAVGRHQREGEVRYDVIEGLEGDFVRRSSWPPLTLWGRLREQPWQQLGARSLPGGAEPQFLMPLEDGRVMFFARDDASGFEPRMLSADGRVITSLGDLEPGPADADPALVWSQGDLACVRLRDRRSWCTDGGPLRALSRPVAWQLAGGQVHQEETDAGWRLLNERGEVLAEEALSAEQLRHGFRSTRLDALAWRGRLYLMRRVGQIRQVMITDGTPSGTRVLGESDCSYMSRSIHVRYTSVRHDNMYRYGSGSISFGLSLDDEVHWEFCGFDSSTSYQAFHDGGPAAPRVVEHRGSVAQLGGTRQLRVSHGPNPMVRLEEGAAVLRYYLRGLYFTNVYSVLNDFLVFFDVADDCIRVSLFSIESGDVKMVCLGDGRYGDVEIIGRRGGLLWFSGRSDQRWLGVTDGTEAGTRLLKTEGPVPLEPRPVLTPAGLVFSMDHPQHGLELFVWPVEAR